MKLTCALCWADCDILACRSMKSSAGLCFRIRRPAMMARTRWRRKKHRPQISIFCTSVLAGDTDTMPGVFMSCAAQCTMTWYGSHIVRKLWTAQRCSASGSVVVHRLNPADMPKRAREEPWTRGNEECFIIKSKHMPSMLCRLHLLNFALQTCHPRPHALARTDQQ